MDCPTCKQELKPDTYESVPLLLCSQCSGYLVKEDRLMLIKGKRDETIEELQQEADREAAADTAEAVKCPRCRVRRMSKKEIRRDDGSAFSIDRCDECRMIWLDGGELARLQIEYETSSAALSQYVHQQRAVSRDSEQRAEFDQMLERNEPRTVMTILANEMALIGLVLGGLVATILLFALSMKYWSLVASAVFFGGAAFWTYVQVDGSRTRVVAWVLLATAQIAYAIYILFFG